MVPASKKLEDLIHLAELCVDLLQQNEEHYAEVKYLGVNEYVCICNSQLMYVRILMYVTALRLYMCMYVDTYV